MPDSEPEQRHGVGLKPPREPAVHPLARAPRSLMGADRSPVRRIVIGLLALGVAVGVALLFVYGGLFGGKKDVAATREAAATAPPPNSVAVAETQMHQLKLGKVETRSFRGERYAIGQIALNEDLTTPIFAPYAGRVTRLFPRPGDTVNKGDVLFEIDSPDLVQAESTLISAASNAQKTRGQLDQASRALGRQRELYQVKAVAQKDLEQAETDYRSADSDFRGATGALAAARDALRLFGKTDREIQRIEQERRTDPIMPVKAPIGGTVVSRKVGPGQYVQPSNADPVYVIADLSKIWMVANVAEMDIPFIHLGDEVEVKIAAYPNELFRARITNIGASVDPATRRVTVRSEVESKGYQLKPQMFATFRIVTDTGAPAAAVPTSAVLRDGDKGTIWVEIGPRRYAPRRIERGMDQGGMTQLLSGATPGETVVIEGAVFLQNALVTGGK